MKQKNNMKQILTSQFLVNFIMKIKPHRSRSSKIFRSSVTWTDHLLFN